MKKYYLTRTLHVDLVVHSQQKNDLVMLCFAGFSTCTTLRFMHTTIALTERSVAWLSSRPGSLFRSVCVVG